MIKKKEKILNNITESKTYFSNPIKAFNDPFDCRLGFDWFGSEEKWIKMVNQYRKENGLPILNSEILRKVAKQQVVLAKEPDFGKELIGNMMKNVGMLCLSGLKDDIIMFSHYSGSHKGFSLGFDFKNNINYLSENTLSLNSINYIDKLITLLFFETSKEEWFDYNLFTKSDKWEYEEEWRIVDTFRCGNHNYPAHMLVEIVLGCEISTQDRDDIIMANEKRRCPAKIFETKIKDDEFGFNRIEIK